MPSIVANLARIGMTSGFSAAVAAAVALGAGYIPGSTPQIVTLLVAVALALVHVGTTFAHHTLTKFLSGGITLPTGGAAASGIVDPQFLTGLRAAVAGGEQRLGAMMEKDKATVAQPLIQQSREQQSAERALDLAGAVAADPAQAPTVAAELHALLLELGPEHPVTKHVTATLGGTPPNA